MNQELLHKLDRLVFSLEIIIDDDHFKAQDYQYRTAMHDMYARACRLQELYRPKDQFKLIRKNGI